MNIISHHVFLQLILTSDLQRKGRKLGVPSMNNRVSHGSSAPTDMTIMALHANVRNLVIIWPFMLFKHSASPYDSNQNSNAIGFHLRMCFPRVWGKHGYADRPRITILNHWQRKTHRCPRLRFPLLCIEPVPSESAGKHTVGLVLLLKENTGVHFSASFLNCTPITIYHSNSSHYVTVLL